MAKAPQNARDSNAGSPPEEIALDLIDQGEQLIRHEQNDDEIGELALHISLHGLLQPIGVRPTEGGRYQLLFGARRLLAHQRLRRPTIRATVFPAGTHNVKGVAAAENLLRRQLTLSEEVDAVCQLHQTGNHSPDQISSLVGKSRAWVLRRLALPSLPDDLRLPVLDGSLALGAAEAIALLDDANMRAFALNQARTTNATVADVRSMVEAIQAAPTCAEAVQAGIDAAQSPLAQQTVMIACAGCGTPRPLADLTLIRVCAHGCTPHQEENTDGRQQH